MKNRFLAFMTIYDEYSYLSLNSLSVILFFFKDDGAPLLSAAMVKITSVLTEAHRIPCIRADPAKHSSMRPRKVA